MSEQNSMMQFATKGERGVARRLVAALVVDGLALSVHDGDEWTVKGSTNGREILDALCTTGSDIVSAVDCEGRKVASFVLIWGNDPDGSELIADGSGDSFEKYLRRSEFSLYVD